MKLYLGFAEVLEAQGKTAVCGGDVHPHGNVDDVNRVIRV